MATIPEHIKSKKHIELVDEIYKLGYEVGFNNHSEIGWVLRDKARLLDEAQKLLIVSPENYYNEGKIKGKLNREMGIGGLGNTGNIVPQTNFDSVENNESNNDKDANEITSRLLPHNKINELPRMVKKIRVTEIPEILKGIKHLRKK